MEKNTQFKVIVADDHNLLRDALASLIDSYDEFRVVATASNGREVLDAINNGIMPDIVLLDLNMPEFDGYETAIWLNEHHPDIRVLVLTMYDSEVALVRLLQVGVRGLLKKNTGQSEMRRALLAIAREGFYYSQAATGKLSSLFKRSQGCAQTLERSMLNEQEIKFLKFASTELTYKEVADKMDITPRAVDSMRDNLFEKLDIKSRVGLAMFAVKNGIITF